MCSAAHWWVVNNLPPENLAAMIILWGQDGLSAAHTGSQKLLKNACSRGHQAFNCILISLMGLIQLLVLPPSFLPLLFLSLPPFFVFFLECSFLYLCLLRFLSWKGIKFCQMLIFLVILYFVNVVNYIVSFQMLSQLCLPQINPAWSLCTTGLNLLIFCWKLTFLFMMNIEV